MPSDRHEYSEDLFADTRMSFGEHIEELRTHLVRALKGLVFCLTIGFVLDAIGTALDRPYIGIGRPMVGVITEPVRVQLNAFYDRREAALEAKATAQDADAMKTVEPRRVRLRLSPESWARLLGRPAPDRAEQPREVDVEMWPLDLYRLTKDVTRTIRPPELTTLSVQEAMVVYFKVSMICGFIIASPWVFWQMWSFIAAGLYPHEKRLVNYWLPISLGLFLGGVLLCQFAVIPRSIEALLWFNEWMGLTPDLRLNEWLGFAIWLPVIFGVTFQTPLVMMALERVGIFSVEQYLSTWRMAVFLLAVFAAVITPTTDIFTFSALWVPMVALYFLGIYLCWLAARRRPVDFDVPESDELIEV